MAPLCTSWAAREPRWTRPVPDLWHLFSRSLFYLEPSRKPKEGLRDGRGPECPKVYKAKSPIATLIPQLDSDLKSFLKLRTKLSFSKAEHWHPEILSVG